jgi:hypothetical protein
MVIDEDRYIDELNGGYRCVKSININSILLRKIKCLASTTTAESISTLCIPTQRFPISIAKFSMWKLLPSENPEGPIRESLLPLKVKTCVT